MYRTKCFCYGTFTSSPSPYSLLSKFSVSSCTSPENQVFVFIHYTKGVFGNSSGPGKSLHNL